MSAHRKDHIPVYMDLISYRHRRRLALHTRLTLLITLGLIVAGWAGLLISEYRLGGVLAETGLLDRVVQTWFQAVSTRTAGFAGFESFANVRQESRLLIASLMFIGSAPASMGGGITTGTFVVLLLAIWNYAKGSTVVRVRHRRIPQEVVVRAIVVFVVGIIAVCTASWLLLATHDFSLDTGMFEVISAFSTTGLSLGGTQQLNTFGRLLIIGMMIWGRVGAVTIVLALLQRQPLQRLVEYPEESVLVG